MKNKSREKFRYTCEGYSSQMGNLKQNTRKKQKKKRFLSSETNSYILIYVTFRQAAKSHKYKDSWLKMNWSLIWNLETLRIY